MSATCVIWPAVTSPGPSARSVRRFGPFRMHAQRDLLHVEHDVGDVLAHARNRGEFVQNALDLDRGHRRTLQRRQQHAAKRVAERQSEAALERLGDDGCRARLLTADVDLELLRFDQFLPIFLEHLSFLIVSRTGEPAQFVRWLIALYARDLLVRLYAASLGCATTIVRNRRHVADRGDGQAHRLQRAQRGFASRRPGPLTSTSSVRMPCSTAFLAASSAATCAA